MLIENVDVGGCPPENRLDGFEQFELFAILGAQGVAGVLGPQTGDGFYVPGSVQIARQVALPSA